MPEIKTESIEFISNEKEVDKAVIDALRKALTKVGMQAESYAKMKCPVDTGLLRNSITYAMDGDLTHIAAYADNKGENSGTYEGKAPAEDTGLMSVTIGTNVHYAPSVELGHNQQAGRFVPALGKRLKASWVNPKPFLRPAMEEHASEYKLILVNEANAQMANK